MKRGFLIIAALSVVMLTGSSHRQESAGTSPVQAVLKLVEGNREYVNAMKNDADISKDRREDTAAKGQTPYAVIITCSDSRVPPEHIFSAGVGDLFVIRTAGNVVGNFELGSIEYGVLHLGAKIVVVMGHTGCGAVSAALGDGHAEGHIAALVNEIKPQLDGTADSSRAEKLNIAHSRNRILGSKIVAELVQKGEIYVIQANYDLKTGEVTFF